jgi:hypothetical protein
MRRGKGERVLKKPIVAAAVVAGYATTATIFIVEGVADTAFGWAIGLLW